MILEAGNVWTRATGWRDRETERLFLNEYLSQEDPTAKFTDAYRTGRWDGKHRLYRKGTDSFPSGLVRPVVERCRQLGIHCEVRDERSVPLTGPLKPELADWLRDYQRPALEAMIQRTRGIVYAPTSAGKTEVFVAAGLVIPCSWLVLVDTKDLMHQAADRYTLRTGQPAGRYGDGHREIHRYTVATVQSLDEHLEGERTRALLNGVQGVVVDEVQIAAGDRCQRILGACENAYWRFGFSATPNERKDRQDFKAVGMLGPILHRIEEAELVEAGAIAPARVVFVDYEHGGRYPSWPVALEDGIVDNRGRNALVRELTLSAPRPTLVHARMLPHVRTLVDMLRASGLRAEEVVGESDTARRKRMVQRLSHRDLDVLVVSKVFNKGIDIPEARSVVNAAGGDSSTDAIQLLGRVMRQAEGKVQCEYRDVNDRGDYTLMKHSQHRMEALAGRGWKIERLASAPPRTA
jgi:superfamily II DNA or RNA helicase